MYPRILALGLAALCVSARATDLIPIEDFAKPAAFFDVEMSPDGQYLGYIREHEGVRRMCVAEISTMKWIALGLGEGMSAPGDLSVSEFDWIGPKRLVIQTVMHDRFYGGWIAVDRDRKDPRPLSGDIAGKNYLTHIPDFFPREILYRFDDDRTVLVSNVRVDIGHREEQYPEVVKLDTRSGVGTTIVKNPGSVTYWCADGSGRIRLGVARGGTMDSILYRESEKDEWRTVASFKGALQIVPIGFAEDGSSVYVRARTPDGTLGLYRYDPAKNQLGEQVWADPKYDNRGIVREPDTRRVIGIRYVAEGRRTEWLDHKYRALQAAVDEAMPKVSNQLLGFSRDGKRVLVQSFSDRSPASAYVFDVEKKQLRLLGASRGWIKPEAMAPMHPVKYPARDGLEINGYLTVPLGQKPFKLPLVIMPHGGPFGIRDEWGFDPLVQMLANRGYAVLQMNYRGSGGYGNEFRKKGAREVGGKIQADIEDATKWAITKNIADPKHIAIVGGSFGGYSALYALGKSPGMYCCGISIAGVTDWVGIYKEIDSEHDLAKRYWHEQIGDMDENEDHLRAISPVNFAEEIKAPVLIIQGKEDMRVPLRQARKMISALEKVGRPPESLFIPDEGHGFMHEVARVQEYKAIEAFLAKHLGPGAASGASVQSAVPAAIAEPAAKN